MPVTLPPAGYDIHAEICLEVPVEHGLLMENLLDLAHAPFTHTSTFARGWPVPDFVKFHANKLLSGNWDPYPINMSFQPPCMVRTRGRAGTVCWETEWQCVWQMPWFLSIQRMALDGHFTMPTGAAAAAGKRGLGSGAGCLWCWCLPQRRCFPTNL